MNHLPFLRAIAQAPHDDLPRLVYADALEESGVPEQVARAHFIRGQIELASTDDWSEQRRLSRATGQLYAVHHKRWNAACPPPLRVSNGRHYVRGFAETVSLNERELATYGEAIFEVTPVKRLALLYDNDGSLHLPVSKFNFLNRISSLSLDLDGTAREPINEMFKRDFLDRVFLPNTWENVNDLTLYDYSLSHELLLQVLEGISIALEDKLRSLDLGRCALLTDVSVDALISEPCLARLETLKLKGLDVSRSSRWQIKRHFSERVVF